MIPGHPAGGRHAAGAHGRHRARSGGLLHRCCLAGVATAAVVLVLALTASTPDPAAEAPAAVSETVRPIALADGATAGATAAPLRVRIPSIGVDSPLVRLGVDAAGALVPPADFARAGWFTASPLPGAVGPSVIAGHVDSRTGPAVFFRLRDLSPGDEILVDRADGTTARFTVYAADRYPKDEFPTDEVYGPTPRAELRLITCGGEFDHDQRSYRDNVVVYATET
jgi:sortase (surface protein transpeptidase)